MDVLEGATINLHLTSSTAAGIHRYLYRRRFAGVGDLNRLEQILTHCDIDVNTVERLIAKAA